MADFRLRGHPLLNRVGLILPGELTEPPPGIGRTGQLSVSKFSVAVWSSGMPRFHVKDDKDDRDRFREETRTIIAVQSDHSRASRKSGLREQLVVVAASSAQAWCRKRTGQKKCRNSGLNASVSYIKSLHR
ncbi:MAG: hypothetical protein JOY96_04055 [Verrucomicrobia bacterium]|nr:hypothetical protein [Verrucomicrobiota bacterium]